MPDLSTEVGSLTAAKKMKRFTEDSKWDYNEKYNEPLICRFCGEITYVYKEIGNFVWHSCDTENCIGNKDTPRKSVSNREFARDMNRIGDVDKLWSNFAPRRVA